MVRCLIGTLEAVGRGKLAPDEVRTILNARDRTVAPETAPPCGLFLMKVFFDEAEIGGFRLEEVPFFM